MASPAVLCGFIELERAKCELGAKHADSGRPLSNELDAGSLDVRGRHAFVQTNPPNSPEIAMDELRVASRLPYVPRSARRRASRRPRHQISPRFFCFTRRTEEMKTSVFSGRPCCLGN